jgi:hypothetical protein
MGIVNLIPWLQSLKKNAFHEVFPCDSVPRAYVFDAAGGLYQVCSLNAKVSAGTMFNLFMRGPMEWASRVAQQRDGGTYHLVLVMDKRERSAPTKAEEQARRAEQRKKQVLDYKARTGEDLPILPEDHVFLDACDATGTRLPDTQQPLFSGLSILHSKNGPASLLRYFERRLLKHPLSDNVCLWVDLTSNGAFRREASTFGTADSKFSFYRPALFSEGEIAAAYYAVQLSKIIKQGTIAVRTDDTDFVPIAFSARDHIAKGVCLHWIVYKNDTKWFDLDAIFDALRKLGFTPSKFIYYCALRGCDHVNKQMLTPRLKEAQVLESFLGLCSSTSSGTTWHEAYHVHRLLCVINPALLDPKLLTDHFGLRPPKSGRRIKVEIGGGDDWDTPNVVAASGSAKLRCVLPAAWIQRMLDIHTLWNPSWGARSLPSLSEFAKLSCTALGAVSALADSSRLRDDRTPARTAGVPSPASCPGAPRPMLTMSFDRSPASLVAVALRGSITAAPAGEGALLITLLSTRFEAHTAVTVALAETERNLRYLPWHTARDDDSARCLLTACSWFFGGMSIAQERTKRSNSQALPTLGLNVCLDK